MNVILCKKYYLLKAAVSREKKDFSDLFLSALLLTLIEIV